MAQKAKEKVEPTGAQSLAGAIDDFKKKLADDIQLAIEQKDTFTLLSSKNDEKVLNQILKIITIFDGGGKVSDKLKASVSDEISAETSEVPEKPKLNIQDFVLNADDKKK